jgi:hypothetical protein
VGVGAKVEKDDNELASLILLRFGAYNVSKIPISSNYQYIVI